MKLWDFHRPTSSSLYKTACYLYGTATTMFFSTDAMKMLRLIHVGLGSGNGGLYVQCLT